MLFYSILNLMDLVLKKEELTEFAKAILKTQEIHEESWDQKEKDYTLTIEQSVKKAIKEWDFPSSKAKTVITNILIDFNSEYWNDAQWWAEDYLEIS